MGFFCLQHIQRSVKTSANPMAPHGTGTEEPHSPHAALWVRADADASGVVLQLGARVSVPAQDAGPHEVQRDLGEQLLRELHPGGREAIGVAATVLSLCLYRM